MASRNVAITEEIYHALEKRKMPGESFTGVIRRLLQETERPSKYFGTLKDLDNKELNTIEKTRTELRELWSTREIE